ncbi:MAG: Flp family type IVb pilin [Desulfobacula sp.]|nr:Flp family type IVb pilin [Desulfobacula sp.]
MKKLIDFLKKEDGATAVEYSIIAAAIAAVIVVAVTVVGSKTSNNFGVLNSAW